MGSTNSRLSREELDDYVELTYLTRREIVRVFEIFRSFNPPAVLQNRHVRLPADLVIENMPALQVNPFRDRLCRVFSSEKDGRLSFEDFLDMMSVLSEESPLAVKTNYAFLVFDLDEDQALNKQDLEGVVNRITGGSTSKSTTGGLTLNRREMDQLIGKILEETDIDRTGDISLAEFHHVITRCPDFLMTFRLRL